VTVDAIQMMIMIELPHLFRIKSQALKIYRSELNLPSSKDLGLHGTSRAALRTLCKDDIHDVCIYMICSDDCMYAYVSLGCVNISVYNKIYDCCML